MGAETAGVAAELGLGSQYDAWLASLDAIGGADGPEPRVRSDADADILRRVGVASGDADVVLATQSDLQRSPGLTWLLQRCRRAVLARLGDPLAPPLQMPPLPGALGAVGRCFPAHLVLATIPATMSWQRSRGIPEDICWDSVNDLGRHLKIYREVHGTTGVDEPWWLTLHLRGLLYEFGRLQFNLLRIGGPLAPGSWYSEESAARHGRGFRPGDDAIGMHIPESGPLEPTACEESIAAARLFFPRYFPSDSRTLAICESWLLDDQLSDYLPPTANIITFQRRFTLAPGWKAGDHDVAQFVFRRPVAGLDGVEQRTTLQRAIVSHLRGGGHWRVRSGWLPL